VNGDVIAVTPNSCRIIQQLDETRVLMEGREGNDISKLLLRERRQMGEKGVVFSLLIRNKETNKIISGPELISKGLTHEDREAWLLEEAKKIVKKVVLDFEHSPNDRGPDGDLKETMRVQLRRFFSHNIGRKPVVLPIILDI
jgi:ribonuclease J